MPGTVKIGCTARLPENRAAELYTTGVPTPFEVVAYWHADDEKLLTIEADVHSLLVSHRIQRNREFFSISPEEAKERITVFLGTYELLEERRRHEARRAAADAQERAINAQKYRNAQDAKRSWEQAKGEIWSQSNLEADREFGTSLEEINRMEDTVGDRFSMLVWLVLWIFTLGVVPLILLWLGVDPQTNNAKNATEIRNRYFAVRDGLFKAHRRSHFDSKGVPYPFNDNDPV